MKALTEQKNNQCLWRFFQTIHSFYTGKQNTKTSKEITLLILQYMLDLLGQLKGSQFTSEEKESLQIARTYWLENAQELEPKMLELCPLIESKINYRSSQQDYQLICLTQVLSVNKDHLDDLPEFLENIHLAGLPLEALLEAAKRCFPEVAELRTFSC